MKKGITLIELLAVIIILAIIALIATPVILNIIKDAKQNANKRSVELFTDSLSKKVASIYLEDSTLDLSGLYETEDGILLTNTEDATKTITLDYTGEKVICDIIEIDDKGKVNTALCKVGGSIEYVDSLKYTDPACLISTTQGEINDYICNDRYIMLDPNLKLPVSQITAYKYSKSKCEMMKVVEMLGIDSCDFLEDGADTTEYILGGGEEAEGLFILSDKEYEIVDDTKYPISTIGNVAFAGKNLVSVSISDNITKLGIASFAINKLKSIEIPSSVKTIEASVFLYNKIKDLKISNGVEEIGESAFLLNHIKELNIPDSVTNIHGGAFLYNDLKVINLGSGLEEIGTEAFVCAKIVVGGSTYGNCGVTKATINQYKDENKFKHKIPWAEGYSDDDICWLDDC